ncbi:MAG: dTDP-glucose 4,6-dehydratase [Flavobacteriales bacterium]|nr:dTDP-glucose 4,6-dehydratase [Flavobacteriales bacterium]
MKSKLLITGGCGFIGSNFILHCLKNFSDIKIFNYDKLTYAGNTDNLLSVSNNSNYHFINHDICDGKAFSKALEANKPEAIIHFAAESHVDRSIDEPLNFVKTNALGTATILDATHHYMLSNKLDNFKFIHVSTDEVFGSLDKDKFFTEQSKYSPSSPYSASKACSDHLVGAWHKTYNTPVITTHCSNNYGPFQFPEKLIPLMISNCIDEKPLPIYGNGENIRDWLFVEDHCRAILDVLNHGNLGEKYNIGGNNEIKNIDIVMKICSFLDKAKPRNNGSSYKDLISFVDDRPGHDLRYAIDSTKIQNQLNWEPLETFESGIAKTIEWYLDNENWWRNIQQKKYNQERLGLNINS